MAVNPSLDVLHYDFDLWFEPDLRMVGGTVTIDVEATGDGVVEMVIDMLNSLDLIAVAVDGEVVEPVLEHNQIVVPFPVVLTTGEGARVAIDYEGVIDPHEEEGLLFYTWDDTPWVQSVDEPFGAHSWIPVVEDLEDKATWDFHATVPDGVVVASNGVQDGDPTDNGDGTVTYTWISRYPNSIYLFCVALGPFVVHERTYTTLDGRTMPVVDYLLPEYAGTADAFFEPTLDMLAFMASRFGEYPYADEKYGHVLIDHLGMEHPTMTFIGLWFLDNWDQSVIIHELAHHWFGDMVTPKTWNDIWLNESFATYCEALWYESLDPDSIRNYGAGLWSAWYDGTVYAEDAYDPFDDQPAIYPRGARVLHMLRDLVGDDVFFAAIRDYLAGHAYGSASTEDLRAAFAAYTATDPNLGDLGWFFDQWIYAPGRPRIVTWYQETAGDGSHTIRVHIKQVQGDRLYKLKVAVSVVDQEGIEHDFTNLWTGTDKDLTTFDLEIPGPVSRVTVDPEGVLLATIFDNGHVNVSDVPSVTVWATRRSGIGELETTLSATSDTSLSELVPNWYLGDAEGQWIEGTTVTGTYTCDYEGYSWCSYGPMFGIYVGDAWFFYPPLELAVLSEEDFGNLRQGDLNWDGVINGADLALVAGARGATDDQLTLWILGDISEDGVIDDQDVDLMASRIETVLE